MKNNETCVESTEHTVSVRSVQVWKGEFDRSFINEDGKLSKYADGLEFHHEKSISLECSCGERFRKFETATDHLRSIDLDTDNSGNLRTDGGSHQYGGNV